MKFVRILVPMIVSLTLLGCGAAKPQSTTPQPPQAQTSTSQVPAASTNATQSTSVSFKWIGVDVDKLSSNNLKTDGKPDAHFHLMASFTQPSAVKSIWIRYSEFGKSFKWGWIYNKNLPTNSYLMAVFDKVGNAILPQADVGYRVDGLTDFDLFISELNNENGRDTFKFEKNQTFNLEIDYVTQNNEVKEFDGVVNSI